MFMPVIITTVYTTIIMLPIIWLCLLQKLITKYNDLIKVIIIENNNDLIKFQISVYNCNTFLYILDYERNKIVFFFTIIVFIILNIEQINIRIMYQFKC